MELTPSLLDALKKQINIMVTNDCIVDFLTNCLTDKQRKMIEFSRGVFMALRKFMLLSRTEAMKMLSTAAPWAQAPLWWSPIYDYSLIKATVFYGLHQFTRIFMDETSPLLVDDSSKSIAYTNYLEKSTLRPHINQKLRDYSFLYQIDVRFLRLSFLAEHFSLPSVERAFEQYPGGFFTGFMVVELGLSYQHSFPIGYTIIRSFSAHKKGIILVCRITGTYKNPVFEIESRAAPKFSITGKSIDEVYKQLLPRVSEKLPAKFPDGMSLYGLDIVAINRMVNERSERFNYVISCE